MSLGIVFFYCYSNRKEYMHDCYMMFLQAVLMSGEQLYNDNKGVEMQSEPASLPARTIYQRILSAKEPSSDLSQLLNTLLRKSLSSPEHFDFLLHRVNWFVPPMTHYPDHLLRLLRLYRGQSKHAPKVIYNMLIESLTNVQSHCAALAALNQLYCQTYDHRTVLLCLRENYPHKLCGMEIHQLYMEALMELSAALETKRTDILEMVMENLVRFDTQVVEGDQWVHQPYPDDVKIVALRQKAHQNGLAEKLDHLLYQFMQHLNRMKNQKQLLSEMLLVFQNKVLPIKTTKMVQLVVLALAETSRTTASTFTSFLLSNLFDERHKENSYRIFNQSNFYLISYLTRSKKLSLHAIAKVIALITGKLTTALAHLPTIDIDENTNLRELFFKHQRTLMILSTLLMIVTQREDVAYDRQVLQAILKEASHKIHFEYFFKEEILSRLNIPKKQGESGVQVKFSNKFLPSTLPLTAQLTDPLMRLPDLPQGAVALPQDVRAQQGQCRKLHKGETPISHCSETVI